MHDLRGNFFLNGRRRRGKERRKGEGKRGNERGRGEKGWRGKRGNGTGKVGATRLKTRIRGTESPRTEIGRTARTTKRKRYRDERHTRKI